MTLKRKLTVNVKQDPERNYEEAKAGWCKPTAGLEAIATTKKENLKKKDVEEPNTDTGTNRTRLIAYASIGIAVVASAAFFYYKYRSSRR